MLKRLTPHTSIKRFIGTYKKPKKIVDPSYIEEIPVYEYPSKSSRDTILFGWGLGEHGALGHYYDKQKKMKGMFDPRFRVFKKPFRMTFGEKNVVTDVAAGFGFSLFVVKKNNLHKVYGTGLNTDSQIGFQETRSSTPLKVIVTPVPINLGLKKPSKTNVIGVSAGRAHSVVVTDQEGVFTFGNNAYGQCGRSIIENEKYSSSRVVHNIPTLGKENIKSVECGQDHTLFLTETGKVYACGWGADGQTGLGHYNIESSPSRVLGDIENENIVKLSCRCDCVLAINDKGDVFGWGNSEYSQIFKESEPIQQINKPILLKKCQGFGKIVDIASAGSYCLMLNEEGQVYSWGYGILGRGPEVLQSWNPEPIPSVLFGKNDFQPDVKVSKIFTGISYSGAINNFGHIYMWGKNKSKCLGLGLKEDQPFPLRVFLNSIGKKLALGVDHTIALCSPL